MKTVINIKTEKSIKQSAQKLAQGLSLSLSAVLNAYSRQFIRNQTINFSITLQMSNELERLLGNIEFDIQKNRNFSPAINSKTKLKKHLDDL